MTKQLFTLLITLCCIHTTLKAQHAVQGTVYQKDSRRPLPGARILLYNERSEIKAQTLSDDKGSFRMENLPVGFFRLIVSFMGNQGEMIPIEITSKTKTLYYNYIQLIPSIKLNRIEVRAGKPLMAIRKDTIEFNADDFPILPNASLHNLIEKVPGLTVDDKGNFYYLGAPIKELFIDGRSVIQSMKESQRVMEILKGNMADKIQISDKRNISGFTEPGKNEKVLNITIKKEMKKGVRGNITAGAGTNSRYNTGANVSLFRDKLMVLGDVLANNNNSLNDISSNNEVGFNGNNQQGINKILNLGNYTTMEIGKKTKLSVTLKHQTQDITFTEQLQRQNIMKDSSTNYLSNTQKEQAVNNTSGNIFMDIQPDNNNKINFMLNVSRDKIVQHSTRDYLTTGTRADTINNGMLNNIDSALNKTYDAVLDYSHKFRNTGRVIAIHSNIKQSWLTGYQLNNSLTNTGANQPADTIRQMIRPENNVTQFAFGFNYSEPLGKYWTLAAIYNMRSNSTVNRQNTFDFDNVKNGYLPNDSLTYRFNSKVTTHLLKPSLLYNNGKLQLNGSAGISLNNTASDNHNNNKSFSHQNIYIDHALTAILKIDAYKTLSAFYNGITIPVDPKSFWPVFNTSNPLYVQLGNPDLISSFVNSLMINYMSNSIRGIVFGEYLEGRYMKNALSTAIFIDDAGRQVSMPINTSGAWSLSHNMVLGVKIKNTGVTLNFNNNFNYTQDNSMVNGENNVSRRYTFSNGIQASYNWKRMLEISTRTTIEYKGSKYSLQENNYADYLQYVITLNANAYLPLGFNVGTSMNHTQNTDAQQQFTLLNSWLGKSFLPNKSLLTKFYVFDLLRQNKTILTSYRDTFRETMESTNLSQYFMVSVAWLYGRKPEKKPLPRIP